MEGLGPPPRHFDRRRRALGGVAGERCQAVRPASLALYCLAGNITLVILYVLAPGLRGPLFGEDRAVETATALLFLAAAIVSLALLIASRSPSYRATLVTASGFGLLGFLDEISFGARLFGWSTPAMYGGGEFDGAHDLVILAYRLSAEADPIIIGAICGSIIVIALIGVLRWYPRFPRLTHRVFADPVYSLFSLFVGGVAIAALIDLDVGFLERLGPLEEIIEMNAALALLLAVLSTSWPLWRISGRDRRSPA